ncbi:MAG: Chaperone protein DnaJ [Holosporales bacterium]
MKNLKKYYLLSGFLSSVFITNIYAGSAQNQNGALSVVRPVFDGLGKLIGSLGNNNGGDSKSGDSTTGNIGGLGPLGSVLGGNGNNASLVPTGQQAPTLSQTVPVIVDPSTGQNTVIDPSTGQPAKIDQATGLASITDPKTGLALQANPQTGQVLNPATGQPASVYNITINNNVNNANNSVNNNIDIEQNKLPEGYMLAPAAVAQQSVDAQGKPITLIQAVKKDTNETIYLQQQTDEQGQRTLHEVYMDGRTVPVSMPPQQEESLYDVLGVSPNASPQQIRAAYHKMALQHHPNQNLNDPMAAERYKKIQNAYSILNNPQGKASYDRKRQEAAVQANSSFASLPAYGMPAYGMHPGGMNMATAPAVSDAEIDDVLSHPYDNERNMRLYKQFMEEAAKDPLKKNALENITDEMPEKYVISTRKALLIDVARKILGEQKQQEFMAQHQQTQQREAELRQRQEQENAQRQQTQKQRIEQQRSHINSLSKDLAQYGLGGLVMMPAAEETLAKYPNLINEYYAQNGAAGVPAQQPGMMPASTYEPATVPSSPISLAPVQQSWDTPATVPSSPISPTPVQQSWDTPATSSPPATAEPVAPAPSAEPVAPTPSAEPVAPTPSAEPVGLSAPAPQSPTITAEKLSAVAARFKAARQNAGG